jgi:hypothetical protein
MLEFTAFLVAVGPLALGITKLVDFVRTFDKEDTWWPGLWIALAFAFGILYALLTAANFVNLIGGLRPEVTGRLAGTWGQVATGIAIGGVASFWHEHLDNTSAKAKANTAAAELTSGSATSM